VRRFSCTALHCTAYLLHATLLHCTAPPHCAALATAAVQINNGEKIWMIAACCPSLIVYCSLSRSCAFFAYRCIAQLELPSSQPSVAHFSFLIVLLIARCLSLQLFITIYFKIYTTINHDTGKL
jgi:hypothetical protein